MVKSWEDIKLTPDNEVAPFTGIPYAFGTADVHIVAADVNMCYGPTQYYACITTDIEGFTPMAMHIHRGEIFENGDIVVDFTPLLEMGKPDTTGCIEVMEMELYKALISAPVSFFPHQMWNTMNDAHPLPFVDQEIYYVNVHLGGDAPTILQAIRGQFVQSFMTPLENKQTVAPFNVAVQGASGMAKVAFEAAGTVACFDVTIMVFDPALGHVHNSTAGSNGPRIFDYSDLKVGPGRFFGCKTIAALGVTVEQVAMILKMPEMYYFDYHLTSVEPEIFTSIRGQFPMN